jgi:DNA (cytosine-5)-methyltransferase 1
VEGFENKMRRLKAIDFFCSGGGMSYGLYLSGIDVIAGIDIDVTCKKTYEKNIPSSKFIQSDISELEESGLGQITDILRDDDEMVFVGCSPCQFWTILNTNKTKSEKSKNLLREFMRFIEYFNPGYVIVENVPGIYHRQNESGLKKFVKILEQRGYMVYYKVVNLNEYGVPQSRKRFSLIANRVGKTFIFPKPDKKEKPTVKDFIGENNGFPRIEAGHRDETPFMHTAAGLSERNLIRIKHTPPNGGTRLSWEDTDLQLDTYRKFGEKNFPDTYGRMSWDKPSPTITTKFCSLSNGRFGHPEEHRALSLREGATLQTFPLSFVFETTSIAQTAKIIGNAVPVEYAKRIGKSLLETDLN